MKIIHLIDYFQPQVGYQETFLSLSMMKGGHQVSVITSDRYYPFAGFEDTYSAILGPRLKKPGKFIEEGIATIRLKTLEFPGYKLVYLCNLRETLKSLGPDLVICHGIYSILSLQAASLKQDCGYKLVYDTHAASFNTDFSATWPKRVFHILWILFARNVIKQQADKIFAIGDEERKFASEDLGVKSTSIPLIRYGVDTQKFHFSRYLRKKIRKLLKIKEDTTLFIYAGKITRNKDLHVLTGAFMKSDGGNSSLLLVGSGPADYLNDLKEESRDFGNIIWKDMVSNNELVAYFSAADAGIWPGDPSASFLEAMSTRLPLVLPYSKETKYLDRSGGIIRFNRGDTEELIEIINNLSKKRGVFAEKGLKSEKYIQRYLKWSIISNIILNSVKNAKY